MEKYEICTTKLDKKSYCVVIDVYDQNNKKRTRISCYSIFDFVVLANLPKNDIEEKVRKLGGWVWDGKILFKSRQEAKKAAEEIFTPSFVVRSLCENDFHDDYYKKYAEEWA